ncbi:DUF885 family protein [Luteibacter sp. ME-Dv--P-043b]|uniref:DUF885 domain-containing protein n=1 Tax=unclassified Luteibacter TaxID=2620188 RepID=UPI002555A391|nr:DUF885 family protein [Luteibacter sp. ME-Dv--P-043b]
MSPWIRAIAFAGLVAGTAHAAAPVTTPADAAFKAIYTKEWAWRNGQAGILTSGEAQPGEGRLDTVDAASQAKRLAYWNDVLAQLKRIDPASLSGTVRVDYEVYQAQVANLAAAQRFQQWQMPFNSDSAFWSDIGYVMHGDDLRTRDDYRKYIDRLRQIPAYMDQEIANMRLGLARGFTVPRAVLDGRDVSIAAVADLKKPEDSALYRPFAALPKTLPAADAEALRAEARQVIAGDVIPAYGRLLTFFRTEYVPGARATLAAESLPDGKAYYRQQILEYTTLDLTPDAIHAIGLREVDRLHKEMVQTMQQTGFKGDFPAFLAFLRSDPQFYAKTPDELLMRTAWVAKQVDAKLGKYFGLLPRQRFAIEPVPADIAPYYTSGRGGPDTYLVNTYDLPSRPLFNMPALTLHESMPGHALQLALSAEQQGLPDFRRDGYISAYGEGWALYSEYLGEEMGIYHTPYEHFGFLTYQMWRACRLVVDTGIHHLGWSRQQAIDYLSSNTALSQREIANEVDRYISWPGQALSYDLGYLKIRALREKAEKALGESFDLRAFHDTVLSLGSVPLPVLEQHVDEWIAAQRKH